VSARGKSGGKGSDSQKVRRLTELKTLLRQHAQTELAKSAAQTPPSSPETSASPSFDELLNGKPKRATVNAESPSANPGEFREAIGEVRRIEAQALPQAPKPAPEARQREADEAAVLSELLQEPEPWALIDGAEQNSFLADGFSPKLLRKLKRSQFQIADEIDLHYENQTVAKRMLHDFLQQHSAHRDICVRVIHGKGANSDQGAILKTMVDIELRRRKDVIAFCTPPQALGGTGAVLVLLRKR
jgi:DNA-nicking Smr family endonuclease